MSKVPNAKYYPLQSGRAVHLGKSWKRKHAIPTFESPWPPYPWGTPKWKELLRNKLNKLVKSPSQLSNIFLEAEKTLTETTKAYPKMAPRLELAESCKVRCWCFTGWLAPWRPSVLGGFSIFSQLAMVDYGRIRKNYTLSLQTRLKSLGVHIKDHKSI